jgi:hypothetical protein
MFASAKISKGSSPKRRVGVNSRARARFIVPKRTFHAKTRIRARRLNEATAKRTFKPLVPVLGQKPAETGYKKYQLPANQPDNKKTKTVARKVAPTKGKTDKQPAKLTAKQPATPVKKPHVTITESTISGNNTNKSSADYILRVGGVLNGYAKIPATEASKRPFMDALITEATVPALDAGNTPIGHGWNFHWAPVVLGSGNSSSHAERTYSTGHFALNVDGEAGERQVDKPFLMPVEDVFSISGRGTVATGKTRPTGKALFFPIINADIAKGFSPNYEVDPAGAALIGWGIGALASNNNDDAAAHADRLFKHDYKFTVGAPEPKTVQSHHAFAARLNETVSPNHAEWSTLADSYLIQGSMGSSGNENNSPLGGKPFYVNVHSTAGVSPNYSALQNDRRGGTSRNKIQENNSPMPSIRYSPPPTHQNDDCMSCE